MMWLVRTSSMLSWEQILTPGCENTDLLDRRLLSSEPEDLVAVDVFSRSARRSEEPGESTFSSDFSLTPLSEQETHRKTVKADVLPFSRAAKLLCHALNKPPCNAISVQERKPDQNNLSFQ